MKDTWKNLNLFKRKKNLRTKPCNLKDPFKLQLYRKDTMMMKRMRKREPSQTLELIKMNAMGTILNTPMALNLNLKTQFLATIPTLKN